MACSAAIMRDGRLIAEKTVNSALTHSQTLMPALIELMEGENLTCADVDMFAAAVGPGSFTGVRIGVCAVKGLCHGADKPVVAVDTLEALALGTGYEGIICPILDARREQVYTALFRCENGVLTRLGEDEALPLAELAGRLANYDKVYFTGDGLDTLGGKVKELMGERALLAPAHLRLMRASTVCLAAMNRADEAMDAEKLTPLYLRVSQAERERSERLTRAKL